MELAEETIAQTPQGIDYFCAAIGSGGTLAGLIKGFEGTTTQVIGIPVLKGVDDLKNRIVQLLDDDMRNHQDWQLVEGYEFGGYAKYNEALSLYTRDTSKCKFQWELKAL